MLYGAGLGYSFLRTNSSEYIFLGVGLGLSLIGSVAGYFGNSWLVSSFTTKILTKIDHYNQLFHNPVDKLENADDLKQINKSYLEVICQQAKEIAGRKAVKEEINVLVFFNLPCLKLSG